MWFPNGEKYGKKPANILLNADFGYTFPVFLTSPPYPNPFSLDPQRIPRFQNRVPSLRVPKVGSRENIRDCPAHPWAHPDRGLSRYWENHDRQSFFQTRRVFVFPDPMNFRQPAPGYFGRRNLRLRTKIFCDKEGSDIQ